MMEYIKEGTNLILMKEKQKEEYKAAQEIYERIVNFAKRGIDDVLKTKAGVKVSRYLHEELEVKFVTPEEYFSKLEKYNIPLMLYDGLFFDYLTAVAAFDHTEKLYLNTKISIDLKRIYINKEVFQDLHVYNKIELLLFKIFLSLYENRGKKPLSREEKIVKSIKHTVWMMDKIEEYLLKQGYKEEHTSLLFPYVIASLNFKRYR